MFLHQRFELGDEFHVLAERKRNLGALLERDQAKLFQPRSLRVRERGIGEVGERGSAPELQCPGENGSGGLELTRCAALDPLPDELLEPARIDGVRR
jgi:hypothetical protein